MTNVASTRSETDARLVQALDEYLAALQAGRTVAKGELLSRYPELAADLEACLASLEFMKAAGVRPMVAGAAVAETAGPAPLAGILGDYRIIRELGRGGMGVVYEAEQISLGRPVALKVLPFAAVLDNKQLIRFKNEAHAAAQLHHTNIVPVFSVGSQFGVHYYAMQYIDGQPLSDVIRELRQLAGLDRTAPEQSPVLREQVAGESSLAGQFVSGIFAPSRRQRVDQSELPSAGRQSIEPSLPVGRHALPTAHPSTVVAAISTDRSVTNAAYFRTVAHLAAQVAEALEHAHENGVIHRDVKPSNLLLDAKGKIWITDFGLAQCQTDAGLTMTGDLVGTVRYMSPEQALAKRVMVDHRTDIYSLAATVYELLTFQPVFLGTDRQDLLRQITFDDPKPPRRINKSVPMELETIVLKAMAKTPSSRYATAQEMADDLERFLEDKPIRAKRPSVAERLAKFARRHRAVVTTATIACAILLVTVAVGASLTAIWLATERNSARESERLASRNLFDSHLNEARALRAGDMGRYYMARRSLQQAASLASTLKLGHSEIQKLRNEAIAIIALRADVREVHRHEFEHSYWWSMFEPGLRYFVHIADADGTLAIYRTGDGQELSRLTLSKPEPPGFCIFSPDGQFLVVRQEWSPKWRVWNVSDPNRPVVVSEHTGGSQNQRACDFSPDGRWFAIATDHNSVEFYQMPTPQSPAMMLARAVAADFQPVELRFHPDGKTVAATHGNDLVIWEHDSGRVNQRFTHPRYVRCVAWHPEGKYLAACSDDFRCYVWNLETGMHQAILTNAEGPVYFNRSGNLLATRGGLAVTRLWDPMSGELLLTAPGQSLGFSRDGKQLAFSTNTYSTGVWEVHQGGEYRLLMDRPDPWVGHMELAFEPGGEMLAITAGGTDEGTRLWDMRTSQQVAEAELGDSVVFKRLGGNLVSVGEGGVHSWPIAIDGSRRVRLGPPQRLYPRIEFPREVRVVISNDYRRFLGVNYDRSRCLVLDLDKGAEPVALDAPSSDTVPLSPDGKWAVTTTPAGILLWDARAGTFVQNLWPSRNGQAGFSPCGRWLVASDGREYRGWRVEQWSQPIWAITRDTTAEGTGGPVAFSPDGRLVTVRRSSVELQLVDVSSGLELVTLQAPRHGRSLRAVFNHDGTMVAETNHNFIAIWDLRRIRERLSDLGLDWDQPPYPPAERKVLNEPLTIEIDYGTNEVARYFECRDPVYRRAHLSWAKKKHELALAQLHSVLRRCPNHSLAANDLAWYYVAGPEALRDPVAAAPLAEKAVKLAPDRREYVNTLGVAYYRLGRFDDAISRLSQSAAMDQNHPGGTAFDFYFLAMSYHELGQPDHAREYMDRATSWCAAQEKLSPAWAEQLKSFHAEADALLTQTSVPQ